MEIKTYGEVYPGLKNLNSVDLLSERYGISKETLKVLLTQKLIRETKRKYFKVKKEAKKLLRLWQSGESILDISRRIEFPPVMVASILLSEDGVSRSTFRRYVKDTSLIPNGRLKRELGEALKHDFVYSPDGAADQGRRGRFVEGKVCDWLTERGVSFKTEGDCRKENKTKTPDFLLEKPFDISGRKVFWVESKATFGDKEEFQRDLRKQLRHYVELFGSGAVVYWYGFLEQENSENILSLSSADIKNQSNK